MTDGLDFTEVRAPWTDEQVKELRWFQQAGNLHPLTCGCEPNRVLFPTRDGLVCPRMECGWDQRTVPASMLDGSGRRMAEDEREMYSGLFPAKERKRDLWDSLREQEAAQLLEAQYAYAEDAVSVSLDAAGADLGTATPKLLVALVRSAFREVEEKSK